MHIAACDRDRDTMGSDGLVVDFVRGRSPPLSFCVGYSGWGAAPPPSPGHGMAALLQRGINVSFGDRYGKKNATILRHRSLIGDWLEQFAVNR